MKATQVAFTLLLPFFSIGEIRVTIADYSYKPIDAVLILDGAPTYLRLTNSTSLEGVYNCILDRSEHVSSMIMSSQIRGTLLNVGDVEKNVNEIIHFLSADAANSGRTLWKSPEELKLFKMRLAHYLSTNKNQHGRQKSEQNLFTKYKSQRSAEQIYNGRSYHSNRMCSAWRRCQHEPRGQFPVTPENSLYSTTPGWDDRYGAYPTEVPLQKPTYLPEVGFTSYISSLTSLSAPEQETTSKSPLIFTPDWSESVKNSVTFPGNLENTPNAEIHPIFEPYPRAPHHSFGTEIATSIEKRPEVTTISAEEDFTGRKLNASGIAGKESAENANVKDEEMELSSVGDKFKTALVGGNVTDNGEEVYTGGGNATDVRSATEISANGRKIKRRRKNYRKRVANSHLE